MKIGKRLAAGARSFLLRFLLPLVLLLAGLFAVEAVAAAFGYHPSGAQLGRLVLLGIVAAVVIGQVIRRGRS